MRKIVEKDARIRNAKSTLERYCPHARPLDAVGDGHDEGEDAIHEGYQESRLLLHRS